MSEENEIGACETYRCTLEAQGFAQHRCFCFAEIIVANRSPNASILYLDTSFEFIAIGQAVFDRCITISVGLVGSV